MMNGRERSDSAIVAVKPTNKAGQPVAEPGEPRAGTEGNADQQSTAGRRTGKAWRWIAYGQPQGTGRRNGSPRSSTTSALICSGKRSSRSGVMPPPAWTG